MNQSYDTIIIGAGISGAAIAFELSKKGFKTLNLERLAAAGHGSTGSSCAIIRTHYSTLEGTALAYDCYFYWKKWGSHVGDTDEMGLAKFYDTGVVVIDPPCFDLKRYLDLHDALNIPYEVWDRATLLRKMPHFVDDSFYPPKRPEDASFGEPSRDKINPNVAFFPCGGYVNEPTLSVHNLQRAAESKGATFVFNAEVAAIRKEGTRVIGVTLTDGRQVDAAVVVNAAGPHSAIINRLAGIEDQMKIKTRALRREVHVVPSPATFSYAENGMVVSDADAGGYHRPEAGNRVLVGSLDPDCDAYEWIADPDDYNRQVTTKQWKAQVYRLAKRIPTLPIPGKPTGIADLYDATADWIPIYDRSDLAGFYLAIGTSGNQYKNGPVIGQLLCEIITACENGHDHDRDPVKVKLRNIDFSVNTGIFSRNREIIKGSTFSVLG